MLWRVKISSQVFHNDHLGILFDPVMSFDLEWCKFLLLLCQALLGLK